ncbi:hypothetical protein BH11PSE13_BH11PSE13_20930 [soil metagenome]
MNKLQPASRDRLYAECARAVTEASPERESLFLARLALLLFEQVADEDRCRKAIADALQDLPVPSLSAVHPSTSLQTQPEEH